MEFPELPEREVFVPACAGSLPAALAPVRSPRPVHIHRGRNCLGQSLPDSQDSSLPARGGRAESTPGVVGDGNGPSPPGRG